MAYQTTYCGSASCSSNSYCYITENSLTCSTAQLSSWRLNSTVFPPIEYVGPTNPGDSVDAACENLQITNDTVKLQVTGWASQFWASDTISPPSGTFYNPLEIGSCIDDLSNNLPNLYCKEGKCRHKLYAGEVCLSSNHCASYICSQGICQPDPSEDQISELTGGFSRPANVHYFGPPPSTQPNTSQVIAIASCVIILLTSLLTIMYAKKICKKHDEAAQDTADTGVGSRMRRGASLLLSGTILTRQNSSATLPRYTVEGDPSMWAQLVSWIMPPGELPPSYESVVENENGNLDGRQGGRTYDTTDLEANAGEGNRDSGEVSETTGEIEGGEEASSEPNNDIETASNRAQPSRASSLLVRNPDNDEEDEGTYERVSMSSNRTADDDNADETTVLNRDAEES
ncbi:9436_t:CDS:1 [Paraglomus occultum]|uniref:9436_t:CDS:1 n=1 Tax=Paraglomus occultum TaxID=144539 RepID=A0A9N8ZWP5_9GLOM|nr:9436_t:CDS:1 [Paraglomus occultum]